MFCHECGTKIPVGGTFCGNCGEKVKIVAQEVPDAIENEGQSDQPAVTIEEMKMEQQEQVSEPDEEPVTGSYTAPIPAPIPTPTLSERPVPRPAVSQAIAVDSRELPMTLGGWIGTMFILLIPLVNIVMPFVWAFGDTNRSKKTFFQAMLLMYLVVLIITIVFSSAIAVFIASFSDSIFY